MSPKSRVTYKSMRRVVSNWPPGLKALFILSTIFSTLFLLQALFGVQVLPGSHRSPLHTSEIFDNSASREQRHLAAKPRQLIVVAAGLPRTGSTWVFNIIRILMRMRDPNSIAGWYADLMAIWKNHKTHRYDNMSISWLDAYKSLGTSLTIKMHGPGAFRSFSRGLTLATGADLTVLTHRDLRTEVRSWVYQNFNTSVHAGKIADTPFGDPSQWVRVAHRILHERNSTLASVGESGKLLDIRYEDWSGKGTEAQMSVLRMIAAELDWEFSDEELREAALEAKRIRPPDNGAALMYNPVSKLHPGHTRIDASDPKFIAALNAGYEAIEQDPIAVKFLRTHGYM